MTPAGPSPISATHRTRLENRAMSPRGDFGFMKTAASVRHRHKDRQASKDRQARTRRGQGADTAPGRRTPGDVPPDSLDFSDDGSRMSAPGRARPRTSPGRLPGVLTSPGYGSVRTTSPGGVTLSDDRRCAAGLIGSLTLLGLRSRQARAKGHDIRVPAGQAAIPFRRPRPFWRHGHGRA